MIVRVSRIRVWPGAQAEFSRLLEEVVRPLWSAQPGMVDLLVGEPMDAQANEFVVVSLWRGLADLRAFVGGRWYDAKIVPGEEEVVRSIRMQHYRVRSFDGDVAAPLGTLTAEPTDLVAGSLRLDVESGTVSFGAASTQLPPRERSVLAELIRHAGKPVPAAVLAFRVWPDHAFVPPENVRRIVYSLRALLRPLGLASAIKMRRGYGYLLDHDAL